MLTDLACVVLAYLLGSISCGILLARWRGGIDPRQSGSGNTGATNVARTLGKTAGLLTLLGDASKGLLAVLLALWWGSSLLIAAWAALSAVLGHLFPVYHGFRGGKGVATALGVLLPLLPLPLLGACLIWLAVVVVWRYVSAGSMLAAIMVPILAAFLTYPTPFIYAAAVIALLILYKHRENMQRLLRGTEHRL